MFGLSLDGVHSSQVEAVVTDVKKPLLAQPRDQYEYIPGRESTMVFNDGYEDKNISVELVVKDDKEKLRNVAKWLHKKEKSKLIFDDEPDVFFMAKVSGIVDQDDQDDMGYVTLQVTFTSEPFLQSVDLGSVTTANNEPIVINNSGTYEALPIFRVSVTSKLTALKLTLNNEVLTFNSDIEAGSVFVIDTENIDIYEQNGDVKTDKAVFAEGIFPTFEVGENTILVEMTGEGTISTEWRRRYL